MARIVIIGAGLTGLSTAYHLEQKGFYDYILLERQETVGGLCGSIEQDGFTFDYTGHLLHINDAYFKQFIETIVGLDFFNLIHRKSYVYSRDRYTLYPYQINLHGLPPDVIIDCITGFVERTAHKKRKTFKDWVLAHFGAGFAKHFFVPYQEKIFSYPVDKITASWTSRFVPSTSLAEILQGTLQEPQHNVGYNAQFYYPRSGGILSWVLKIAQNLKNPIALRSSITKIDTHTKMVHTADGRQEPYDTLINTMPLDRLLHMLIEKPNMDCKKAAKKLLCNSVFNFNLGINRPDLNEKHWIYYPEQTYPFYRIGFPHNLSAAMTPPGCSSLSGEIAFLNKDIREVEALYRSAQPHIERLFGFSTRDIITEKTILVSHAFVTFDFWREKHLASLLARLAQEQIHSIGRYGAWKYASMQEAVLEGKQIAEALIVKPAHRHSRIRNEPIQKKHIKKEIVCLKES